MDVFLLLFFLTTTTTTTTKRLGRSEVNKESIRADAVDFGEIHAIQSNHPKCIRLPTTATDTHSHTHTLTHPQQSTSHWIISRQKTDGGIDFKLSLTTPVGLRNEGGTLFHLSR